MTPDLDLKAAREAADGFDWFDGDTACEAAGNAIRLYHARAVAPLVEAAERVCATWSFYGDTTLMAQLRAALAPFQQGAALSALAEADGPFVGEDRDAAD